MTEPTRRPAAPLIRTTLLLQLKLLIGAARDLVLSPLTLVAAVVDLGLLRRQEPRYLRLVLQLGERSEAWIDLWSGAREPHEAPRENVDALLARVEEVVRDPQTGARRARVLKRWAEREIARRRAGLQRAVTTRAGVDSGPGDGAGD